MPSHPTGKPIAPSPAPAVAGAGLSATPRPRAVDMGRESHLVPWGEWFGRSQATMKSVVPDEFHKLLRFRVTMVDGRQYLVREIRSHVAKGRCTIEKTRWHERDAVCDVITGYLLIGNDAMGIPTTVTALPEEIRAVECVLAAVPKPAGSNAGQDSKMDESIPFGFARFAKELEERPAGIEEVEESSGLLNDDENDPSDPDKKEPEA